MRVCAAGSGGVPLTSGTSPSLVTLVPLTSAAATHTYNNNIASTSKNWPSRQPVNCHFCGVRISMAFNLRNHVRRCKLRPSEHNNHLTGVVYYQGDGVLTPQYHQHFIPTTITSPTTTTTTTTTTTGSSSSTRQVLVATTSSCSTTNLAAV